MNVTEGHHLNRLLDHVLQYPNPRHAPTVSDARMAAAHLAERAYKALGSGHTHASMLAATWPPTGPTVTALQLDAAAQAMHDEVWPEVEWAKRNPGVQDDWRTSARLAAAAFGLIVEGDGSDR